MEGSASNTHTIVGFSEVLDRRPLRFLKPLPKRRICSCCGIVPREIARLPCRHQLCRPCYDQSRQGKHLICALDGEANTEDGVEWSELALDNFMSREVACWNTPHGCDVATAVSDVSRHFHEECAFHFSSCPKCTVTVLCNDMLRHVRSCAGKNAVPGASCRAFGAGARIHDVRTVDKGFVDTVSEANVSQILVILTELRQEQAELHHRVLNCIDDNNQMDDTNLAALFGHFEKSILRELNTRMEKISTFQNGIFCELVENLSETAGKLFQEFRQTKEAHQSQKKAPELHVGVESVAAFRKYVEDGAGEIRAATERLLVQNSSQGGLLNEILTKLQNIAGVLTQGNTGSSRMRDCSAQTAAKIDELKETVTNAKQMFLDGLSAMLQNAASVKQTHTFFLTGVSELGKRAEREYKAPWMSGKVYMFGYLISSGFYAIGGEDAVTLWSRIVVHKGIADDFLQWPFQHDFKLSIIHPTLPDRLRELCVTCAFPIERPKDERGNYQYFHKQVFHLWELVNEGYVGNDRLNVCFELLPSK